jgi:hypothetical protein
MIIPIDYAPVHLPLEEVPVHDDQKSWWKLMTKMDKLLVINRGF